MNNGNEPITAHMETDPIGNPIIHHKGLTKREHFAAMAMQGLMSSIGVDEEWNLKEYSNTAVEAADALLAALEGESS